jgi:hypothetical protein
VTREQLLWMLCFNVIAERVGIIPALIIGNTFKPLEIEVV